MVAMRTCISVFIQMIEKESLGDFIVLEKETSLICLLDMLLLRTGLQISSRDLFFHLCLMEICRSEIFDRNTVSMYTEYKTTGKFIFCSYLHLW